MLQALQFEVLASSHKKKTGDADEDENLNTWNVVLELLTMPGSSPALQQSLQDGEVCRVAMSCHSRWTVGICPWNGKQGSDCRDTQMERCESTPTSLQAWKTGERLLHAHPGCAYIVQYVMGIWKGNVARKVAVRQGLRRLCQGWTKIGLGPSAPRTGAQFCLSFA